MQDLPTTQVAIDKQTEAAQAVERARIQQMEKSNRESEGRIIQSFKETLTERPYLNREIDARFEDMNGTIASNHDAVMNMIGEVLTQTKKTNGSVASLKVWRGILTGGLSVISVIVLPLLGWALIEIVKNSTDISTLTAQVGSVLR